MYVINKKSCLKEKITLKNAWIIYAAKTMIRQQPRMINTIAEIGMASEEVVVVSVVEVEETVVELILKYNKTYFNSKVIEKQKNINKNKKFGKLRYEKCSYK